jgi:hypothetical protein
MSHFIVEHRRDGQYVMETLSGVEDIDTSMYKDLMGIWVCDSDEEVLVMKNELRRMRHARHREQA